jgi:nucleoid-associated protein YgaU
VDQRPVAVATPDEVTTKPVSHEAKLGMMVVTILVFAFCFLVYRKMDLHQQRQLASIAPGGQESVSAASNSAPNESTSGMIVPETSVADAQLSLSQDPLLTMDELSDGSPFTAGGQNFSEGPAEVTSELNQDSSANLVDTAPVQFRQPDPETNEMVELNFTPATGNLMGSGLPLAHPKPTSDSTEMTVAAGTPAVADPGLEFAPDSEDVEEPVAVFMNIEKSAPEFRRIDDSEIAATAPEATGQTITEPFPAIADELERLPNPQQTASTEGVGEFQPDIEFSDPGPVADGQPAIAAAASETSDDRSNGASSIPSLESFEAAEDVAELSGDSAEMPTMIAMAEPQDGFPLSDGFVAEPTQNSTAESPSAFFPDSSPSQPVNQNTSSSARGRGFQAITQPSGRSPNAIRSAVGSGADGKFSLAAFNSQNSAVDGATEDGTAYESVVVQKDDNYSRISKRVYGTVRYFSALAVFNQHRIAEPKHMRPGMVVLTPDREVLEELYPQLFVDSQPKQVAPAEFMILDDGTPAYRVGERETLSEISQRFLGRSSRWIEIYRLNQNIVKDPEKLKAGLILALPDDATEVHVAP